MDAHLKEPMSLAKDVHVEAAFDFLFEELFSSIVVTKIKHVIDMKDESNKRSVG